MTSITQSDDLEEGGGGGFITHLPAILWQRRWFVIVPLILGAIGAAAAVLLIPSTYQSTAIMLVQSPQLPGEVLGGGAEIVDRRIARIRQQVTSRPDLVSLIERHGLYQDERSRQALSEIVDTMRTDITLTPTTADVPSSRADERTIAFQLSFSYEEPSRAQAVTQDLMERMLELDASGNAEQATNTVQFLTDQSKDLETQIASLQGQIATITAQNGGILSSNGVTMLGGNGGSYDVQIAALQRDNATLVAQQEIARGSDNRDPVVVTAETQLAAARAIYSETHPDVAIAKQRLAEARTLARNNVQKLPLERIDQQIAFNNSQIAALRAAQASERGQVSSALSAQARAPLVQQQIAELQQRLSGLNEQYEGVSKRLLAAKAGVRAEDEQMGERLTVVEPPIVADSPIWPDRPLIGLIGVGGGLALGLLLALAVELMLSPIRNPDALARITRAPPLAVIPMIKRRKRAKAAGGRRPMLAFLGRRR